MVKIFKKIYDFIRYDIPQGVENLFLWYKVIWNDRNWDQYFIYVILRHKLILMEKNIRNGHTVGCDKEADNIKICILILDRIINDVYFEMVFDKHAAKWGEPKLEFTDSEKYPDCKTIDVVYKNVKTEKDKEQESKDFKRASNHERYLKQQDLDYLFKIMRKHIESWWD